MDPAFGATEAGRAIIDLLHNDDETTETIVEELLGRFSPEVTYLALEDLKASGRVRTYHAFYADFETQEERTWWSIRQPNGIMTRDQAS